MTSEQQAIKEAVSAAEQFRAHIADEELRESIAAEVAQRVAIALHQAAQVAHEFEAVEWSDDIPIDKQFFSIGHVCQMAQVSPAWVRLTMKAKGLKFAECRNEVPYLDATAMLAVVNYKKFLERGAKEAGEN